MEYREFMEQIKKDLPERLSGTLEGATVDTTQVDRLQGCSYEGLSIVPDGSMIGLTMDLQPYFQMFSNGISYENIVEQIADRAAGAYADRPAVTAEDFGSYEAVKDKLMIQLIGRKGNEEMLKTIPHHPIEDMEIVYRFHVQDTEMGQPRPWGQIPCWSIMELQPGSFSRMPLPRQYPISLLRLKPWQKS